MRPTFLLGLFLALALMTMVLGIAISKRKSKSAPPQVVSVVTPATNQTLSQEKARIISRRETRRSQSLMTNSTGARLPNPSATNKAVRRPRRIPTPDSSDPAQLEVIYRNQTNAVEKYGVIDRLNEIGTLPALQALNRLTQLETDPDFKIELLDSINFFEGHTPEKLQILSEAVRSHNSTEVRQAAIDGLLDIDDRSAIAILRSLINDPDEEVREAAQDALEFYEQ